MIKNLSFCTVLCFVFTSYPTHMHGLLCTVTIWQSCWLKGHWNSILHHHLFIFASAHFCKPEKLRNVSFVAKTVSFWGWYLVRIYTEPICFVDFWNPLDVKTVLKKSNWWNCPFTSNFFLSWQDAAVKEEVVAEEPTKDEVGEAVPAAVEEEKKDETETKENTEPEKEVQEEKKVPFLSIFAFIGLAPRSGDGGLSWVRCEKRSIYAVGCCPKLVF